MYQYKDGRLKNKCALVIGATSGIGQSCAEMFAAQDDAGGNDDSVKCSELN
jgi:NAD(P)-dependent dehydrogenase (short-subunit alcohol dehydrogenase family)